MTTLITGATGKTGRRIIERLNGRDVRPASRTTGFDWNDSSTWEPMLDGVEAAYISYFPDLAVPGAAETVGAFARLAAERGVMRLVLLSGRGEPEAQRAEQAIAAAGAQWTVVRCSWFAQNFSEAFIVDGVATGEVALPAGDVPEPFVDAEDIADVATAALTEDGHHGEVYELTGPRALTFDEAVAEIAAATGRQIRFTPVPVDAFAAAMREAGAPDEEAALVAWLFTEVLDGRNAQPQDGVRRALGRAPRDFAEYARRTAATGAWN
ncbi:MAG TPA: NmrA family transcriptional regulator [Solirubrobacter sp.]|nr:NmrA family transcriptional regulator [Solirubrobacter sp.]